MADTVTKICMDIYRKLEKSRVLNIIEDLQIPDVLEIYYFYNLLWKYVKKYISIQASIFLFVLNILNAEYITLYSYLTFYPTFGMSRSLCLQCAGFLYSRKLYGISPICWFNSDNHVLGRHAYETFLKYVLRHVLGYNVEKTLETSK
jgi:hypothetical protein